MSYKTRQAQPLTLEDLTRYVREEFQAIERELSNQEIQTLTLVEIYIEPFRPLEGLLVNAKTPAFKQDGVTSWAAVTSGGSGLYQYRSGAWVKIG